MRKKPKLFRIRYGMDPFNPATYNALFCLLVNCGWTPRAMPYDEARAALDAYRAAFKESTLYVEDDPFGREEPGMFQNNDCFIMLVASARAADRSASRFGLTSDVIEDALNAAELSLGAEPLRREAT